MAVSDVCTQSNWPVSRTRPVSSGVRGWLLLGAWIAALAAFMFGLGPALLQRSALHPMAQLIEERGIEANMYFYTEVEAFYEANVNMDNTWAYPHRAADPPRR